MCLFLHFFFCAAPTFDAKRFALVNVLSVNQNHNFSITEMTYNDNGVAQSVLPEYHTYDEIMGIVTVAYRHPNSFDAKYPVDVQAPWLKEEYHLLQSITSQVSLMIHSRGSDTLLSCKCVGGLSCCHCCVLC